MNELVMALIVPFVAGFIVQRFLDIIDPLTSKLIRDANTKKIVLGIASLTIGCILAYNLKLKIFHTLLKRTDEAKLWLDYLFTGIFISGGTEGFNSLLKFANYKKEASKAEAAAKMSQVSAEQLRSVNA
jgi:uncharacterized membrane protein YraQ (UPF0718 family)